MNWQTYGDWAFYITAVISVLFAVLYLLLAPWWRSTTGRNVMAVMGTLAVAFTYFAWVISKGGVPQGFYPMRAFIFTCLGLSIGWRLVMFVRHHLVPSLTKEDEDAQVR